MMKNIVIIGAGQLGSRHLQAFALFDEPCNLFVVDPNEASLLTAKQRFEAIAGYVKHKTSYHNSVQKLTAEHLDLVIIATNADIRAQIIKELLQSKSVSYFILEKVLFQSIKDYKVIGDLLHKASAKAYVNCPRRIFDFYKNLKAALHPGESVQMEIIGNNWGLACNSIHFIDLFNLLTGDTITDWQNNLNDGIIESKRPGFIEINGNISGRTSNANSLSLTCYHSGHPNISIRISTPSVRLLITEGMGKAFKEEASAGWKTEEIPFTMIYQSQITNVVVKQLFDTGSCDLAPYETSSRFHTPFLRLVLNHYKKHSNKTTDICPIT
jgi:predicted dehydrogenase